MTEEQQQLIINKLDGVLTAEQEERFRQYMDQDTEFAQEYALQQGMVDALRSNHEQALRQQFQAIYNQVEARQQRRKVVYYGMVAAIGMMLLGTLAWWYLGMRSPSSQQLFITYYTPYQADPLVRGKAPAGAYQQAIGYYRDGRYRAAIPLLKEVLATDTSRQDKLRLLLGNSYLQVDSTTQAVQYLTPVAASDDPMMQQFGQWYLALSYLRVNDTAAAHTVLKRISNQTGMYSEKAGALIEELSQH